MLLLCVKEKREIMETKHEEYVFSGQEELGEAYNPLRAETNREWLFVISCDKFSMFIWWGNVILCSIHYECDVLVS